MTDEELDALEAEIIADLNQHTALAAALVVKALRYRTELAERRRGPAEVIELLGTTAVAGD